MVFGKLYVSNRFFFEKVTPVQVFWQWHEISKVDAVETHSVKFDLTGHLWKDCRHPFGGTKNRLYFQIGLQESKNLEPSRDTLLSLPYNIDMSGIVGHNLKMFRFILAVYIVFLQIYTLLLNLTCIGIDLPHQEPFLFYSTKRESRGLDLQCCKWAETQKETQSDAIIHFQVLLLLGFREGTFSPIIMV